MAWLYLHTVELPPQFLWCSFLQSNQRELKRSMCLSDTDISSRINHAITCRQLSLFFSSLLFFFLPLNFSLTFSFLFQNSFLFHSLYFFFLPYPPQIISGISTKNLAQVVNFYVHLDVQYNKQAPSL